MTVRLYSSTYCPFAWATRIVLNEKDVSYRIFTVDPQDQNEEFRRLSPNGKVPLLVDGKVSLCESLVIAEYVEERYPEPNLIGDHPEERALVRTILLDCVWYRSQPLARLAAMLYYQRDGSDPERGRRQLRRWQGYLDELEARLEEHEWIALDRLSLADIHLFTMVGVSRALGAAIDENRPALAEWFARIAERDTVKRSVPDSLVSTA